MKLTVSNHFKLDFHYKIENKFKNHLPNEMLMRRLRQILNMSPALLIDNNIFNSPFGTASDHSSRSKPTPSFSKMMQKALKNKTHNLLEPHHTIVSILCNRKKNDGLVIFTYTYI